MITYEKESSLGSTPLLPPAGFDLIAEEFASQIVTPPDNYIKNCYLATLKLMRGNPTLNYIFSKVLLERTITPQHFVNLYARTIQHIELTESKNPNYPTELTDAEKWMKEIERLVNTYAKEFLDLMLHRSTQTTIYQRSAGPKFIISSLFGKEEIKLADLGCGGNYCLPGLTLNEPFSEIEDYTPDKKFSLFLNKAINVKSGLAIDQEDPYAPGSREWLHSCSFYPSELGKLKEILAFEERISEAKNITFIQKDITMLTPEFLNGHVKPGTFDAVIFSTVLYQDPKGQDQAFENARSILKPSGVIIIQDFAIKSRKNKKRLDFNREWHVPGNYRTFVTGQSMDWEMKEVLKWDRARCNTVQPGKDFELIVGR